MRPPADRHRRPDDVRRALDGLDGLPLRPLSARAALDATPEPDAEDVGDLDAPKFLDADPGWALFGPTGDAAGGLLARLAGRPWWRASSPEAIEALETLWRHAVATSGAARRLAAEAGREDVERLARAGLLQKLGLWAVAAVDPELLAEFLAIRDPSRRAEAERSVIGRETSGLGRDLAERWGLDPLTVASCWLHADADAGLNGLADDPEGLAILQEAHAWAERTPWALGPSPLPDPGPTDARLRILIAEVQVRCSAGLLDAAATPREEELTRRMARLRLLHEQTAHGLKTRDRLLAAISEGGSAESPERWAERASRVLCEEPGVASAKVVWRRDAAESPSSPSARVVRLGRSPAELHLGVETPGADVESALNAVLPAWSAWAEAIAERDRRGDRLDSAVTALRDRVGRDAEADRTSRLAALAEFAAGAGHELNNPLAVILGRAQLLLPRVSEPDDARSLRTIIAQAQRAHRILRDLMYVARPPSPRLRPCRPEEIARTAVRDLKPEADARGIRLVHETREPTPAPVGVSDPDALRHLIDVLVRNALEATPPGGSVRLTSGTAGDRLAWVVRDSGRGLTPDESRHLFDPFFCGRQAGRGLGLGLSRAGRFVALAGGDLNWRSSPGNGSVFSVSLPFAEPVAPFVA